MNQKYKAGVLFGIFCMITSFVNNMFIFPEPDHSKHMMGIVITSVIGGAVGRFLYGWFTIWYRARGTKSVE
ncbi:hypothetical protein [uncultured Mucilaginibacter sp.]|uniref:hypothetical protein n=1 Tax=uncultured Mucilaginibacter sp. TaxID=797541 RepID=UPI0025FBEA74|nr:hypothetical protein [uncultured Mucilaginibacter sp.]